MRCDSPAKTKIGGRLQPPRRILLLLVALFVMSTSVRRVAAQSSNTNSSYWRYDAPGQLNHISVADVNDDGIDEFVIVAGETNLMLIGSDGRPLWSSPFQVQEPIRQVQALNVDGPDDPLSEIAVGTAGQVILLDTDGLELWRRPLGGDPVVITKIDSDDNGLEEVLVALNDGRLQLFNEQGHVIWRYLGRDQPAADARPRLLVDDLDRDGESEIIFNYFTAEGFSKLAYLEAGATDPRWERSNSGSVTALTTIAFEPEGPLEIVLSTTLHRVYLYSADGQRRWPYRSMNKPITALTAAQLETGPALLVGTSVGTVIAYDGQGRRVWSWAYSTTPDRPVILISSILNSARTDRTVAFSVILGKSEQTPEPADVLLLDSDGRSLEAFIAADSAGLSQMVDINRDGNGELLLASFATMELLDPGIGVREYFEDWDYRLGAQPQTVLTADIDRDGEEELLVGTNDGRLHALQSDGTRFWQAEFGGVVSALALAESAPDALPDIIVVHNHSSLSESGVESLEGVVEVLRPDGRSITTIRYPTTVTSILVGDINLSGRPELLVGTSDGQVIAASLGGDEFWRSNVSATVNQILIVNGVRGTDIIVSSRANAIDRLSNKGTGTLRMATYIEGISNVLPIEQVEELNPQFVVVVEDGTARGLSARGNQIWETQIGGQPVLAIAAGDGLLVATDDGQLLRIDFAGSIQWRVGGLGRITSLYWGDLDGDVRPDIAVGNRAGEIRLLTAGGQQTITQLDLVSEIFHVTAFRQQQDQQAELIAITDNGVVQLFKAEANRPPLLINPRTEVSQGRYNINLAIVDVESDPVAVTLELYDTELGMWVEQGKRTALNGSDTLFWAVEPPGNTPEVQYRFLYDDGSHSGLVAPNPGPAAVYPDSLVNNVLFAVGIVVVGSLGAWFFIRQASSPSARVRRFYQRHKQLPSSTLSFLENEYARTSGSPEFLLNLASKARQEQNQVLANLADGLFLLTVRPEAALPIINGALETAGQRHPDWEDLSVWKSVYGIGQAMLAAPTTTELGLLRPLLEEFLTEHHDARLEPDPIAAFLPVLTSMRDSGRVDHVDDRLVYLNESAGLLRQLQDQSRQWPVNLENALFKTVIPRSLGLVSAEIEDLRGRAQLVIELKTKRLISETATVVALEVQNIGRAPAEHVVVSLTHSSVYKVHSPPQVLHYLPSGRKRQVQFDIEPLTNDSFRIAFGITYSDRQSQDKKLAFADMVHLLAPRLLFEPIINPYSPGTPLRRNSLTFVGRKELFKFVGQNAGRLSQQNVLILVGQRRTGKTSALLQIDRHLPEHLFPIYIDCQSLGVVPGMAALLHDLAWIMADALAARGWHIDVPSPSAWQEDPAGRFERQFLLEAQALLPEGTIMLLIFDEFEAFENLVNDHILPATLFTYLRHLMQHGRGLAFIFAGTHRLEEMGTEYWSVLFNIALYRHVGYLDDEATRRLISEPVAPNIIYDDLALEKIIRVTAGHPYFLQLVCYTLVNRANEQGTGYVTISDVNAALDEMLRLGEVHFAYLWQRSTRTERALLVATANLMDADTQFRPADLVNYLGEYGVHLNPAEVTAGLNRLVEREIMRESSFEGAVLYELRIELVGLWVAQNKSLARLYESNMAIPELVY